MTVSVAVDRSLCLGSGQCARLVPEVFGNDDDGLVELNTGGESGPVPAAAVEQVRSAAIQCPAAAIQIEAGRST